MREIKFRAWNQNFEKMSKPFTLFSDVADYTDNKGLGNVKALSSVEDVMQYTGLKDKNSQEIYEGDIVKVEFGVCYSSKHYPSFKDDTQKKSIITVKFDIEYQCYNTQPPNDENFERIFEVIGNIYQHKHLLNEK